MKAYGSVRQERGGTNCKCCPDKAYRGRGRARLGEQREIADQMRHLAYPGEVEGDIWEWEISDESLASLDRGIAQVRAGLVVEVPVSYFEDHDEGDE